MFKINYDDLFQIDHNANLLTNDYKGYLTVDPQLSLNTKIQYVKTSQLNDWTFGIKNVWVEVGSRQFESMSYIFNANSFDLVQNDMGTFRIGKANTVGPRIIVDLLFRAVNAVSFGQGQYYVFKSKLSKLPPIHFELDNGIKFIMGQEDILHEEVRLNVKILGLFA
jgi:hypothetical protein